MPTYDYICSSCGHEYELFQSITAKPQKKCPACGRMTAKRLIGTGGGIIFKGSGFYETDYRSESYKQAAKADSGSGSNGEKTKTKSSEKKVASKTADSSGASTSKSSD